MSLSSTPSTPSHQASINVILLLCDDMLAAGHTLAVEMLRGAEEFSHTQDESPRLNIHYVSSNNQQVLTRAQLPITPNTNIEQVPTPTLVIIPSLWRNPRKALHKHRAFIPLLQQWRQQGADIVAVGTGVCFLAEAGLLDKKPATTHWHYLDQFERDYPQVELKRDYFITQVHKLYCAASLNALADLCVHLTQQYYGLAAAHHIERHFSHEIRQPYEQRRFLQGDANQHTDEEILNVQLWLQQHLGEEISLEQTASTADMSSRTLSRRFRQATGLSFSAYLIQIRLETARELLKTSNLPIEQIADRIGYSDSAYFSRLFKKHNNVSPREYRSTVRRKLFSLAINTTDEPPKKRL